MANWLLWSSCLISISAALVRGDLLDSDPAFSNEYGSYQAHEIKSLPPNGIIKLRGFNYETHNTRTRDGYNINMIRIVNPKIRKTKLKRPIVFLHGLMESQTIWLMSSRNVEPSDQSDILDTDQINQVLQNTTSYPNPAFWLSNFAYDVWLAAFRGVEYSTKRDTRNASRPEYWNYCLDDFALFDLPAIFKYIRDETGHLKLGYVGHSQATFAIFALLSTRPWYADIVEPIVAVAPVAYLEHVSSAFVGPLVKITALLESKSGPFPRDSHKIRKSLTSLCSTELNERWLHFCDYFEVLNSGLGQKWPAGFTSHMPFRTSLKVMAQFGQLILSKRFARYDYGRETNLVVYGREKSPSYKVENIESQFLCLISSETDILSAPKDVERFRRKLVVPLFRDVIVDQNINHMGLVASPFGMDRILRVALEALISSEESSY